MDEAPNPSKSSRNRIVIFLVLFALVAAGLFAGYIFPRGGATTSSPTIPTSTLTATSQPAMPREEVSDIIRPTIGLATPWAVEGGAGYQTPTPEYLTVTAAPITLLGPPSESFFGSSTEVTFYWEWLGEVTDDQHFVIYASDEDRQIALATLSERNLGTGFQAQLPLASLVGKPGRYGWQVVLVDTTTGITIAQSEIRPIVVMEG